MSSSRTGYTMEPRTPSLQTISLGSNGIDRSGLSPVLRRSGAVSAPIRDIPGTNGLTGDNLVSIDSELRKYGYDPVQKITLSRASKSVPTVYIKARSPLGFFVFVEIDSNGYTSFSPYDLTMQESARGKTLPIADSFKRGVYDDVGEAAIICREGVCQLSRNPIGTEPLESTYVYSEEPHESAISTNNSAIAYPVVYLKEIQANAGLVLENTRLATQRLRAAAYQKCITNISEYRLELEKLFVESDRFARLQNEKTRELHNSIVELTQRQDLLLRSPVNTELQIQDRQINKYNLDERNDLIDLLIELCAKYRELTNDLKKVNVKVEEINTVLNSRLSRLDVSKLPPVL